MSSKDDTPFKKQESNDRSDSTLSIVRQTKSTTISSIFDQDDKAGNKNGVSSMDIIQSKNNGALNLEDKYLHKLSALGKPATAQKVNILTRKSLAFVEFPEGTNQNVTARHENPKLKTRSNQDSPSLENEPKTSPRKKKKKKKRKLLSICTSNCKYEVVRRVATRYGMREVREDDSWNLYWTDLSVSVERAKEMKRFQKINHFPGMIEICRKDLLARNLNRMLKIFPKDYNFFPMTWCLPHDHGEFNNYARTKRNKTYICKPDTGCQGRGIYLTKNFKDIKPYDRMICQVYIPKPFLIDGLKFDLRVYTLLTSCDPLRIFVYNDGLVRFATSPYKEPTVTNSSNVFMHLTNYAVNKHSRTYKVDDEAGTKRKISTLNRYLSSKHVDIKYLWARIDDVIIKTVIAAHPILKHSYNACFPSHDFTYACFEILGFDILLDHNLRPHLLEVNHSPSFHTDAKIDRDIKETLLNDTFNILNLSSTDKRKIIDEDRKRVRDRLLQGIHKESNGVESGDAVNNDPRKIQAEWEESHLGNFRCVYPARDNTKYEPFFNQTSSSLFQDTAASRAREECARVQRLEAQAKASKEATARKLGVKVKDMEKIRPESPASNSTKVIQKTKLPPTLLQKRKAFKPRTLIEGTQDYTKLNSFEPELVSDAEEKERKSALAQREFLIRSYGIIEQIYLAMLKNGTLRDQDKSKYGSINMNTFVGKQILASDPSKVIPKKLPSMFANVASEKTLPLTPTKYADAPSPGTKDKLNVLNVYDLNVTCSNLPITVRPMVPRTTWTDDKNRALKNQLSKSITNSLKLQSLEKLEGWLNNPCES